MEKIERLGQLTAMNEARDFVRWIKAHAIAAQTGSTLDDVLQTMPTFRKATVGALSTTTAADLKRESRAFMEIVERRTVLGRLIGTLSAPPNTPIPTPTTDPVGGWITEGGAIPLAAIEFSAPRTAISKYAFLLALSAELTRMADDRGLNVIERVSVRAVVRAEDALLLSDTAAVDQGNPAGLLNGLTAVGGGSPDSMSADFESLWTEVADGDPDRPYFVLSPRGAMYLAALHVDGTPLFPGVSPATGGFLFGVPVLLSKAAGAKVILIDAARLAVTDEGITIEQSRQTAIQMLDNPSNGAANLVSAFQTNTAVLRVIRYVHWTKLTDDAVAFLELPIAGSPA